MKNFTFKVEKVLLLIIVRLFAVFSNRQASNICSYAYQRWGMIVVGKGPRYISWRTDFDGTNFRLIELGEGCTISSFCRILTHDWSADTIAAGLGYEREKTLGSLKGIKIGDYSFVGTNSVVMPGAEIGKCVIIGAGTVVRGKVPDFSIYIGSPGRVVGDTRKYVSKIAEEIAS